MNYNVIIVDDHEMFLDGISSILSNQKNINIVFKARDGEMVLNYLNKNKDTTIDLIILDIDMPKINGILLNKKIKQRINNSTKTLVISMHNDYQRVDDLINNKVDGYLLKSSDKEELLKAVSSVLKGERYFSQAVYNIYFDKSNKIDLSERELDIITLIAQEHTSQEIADKLYLSKHTVESYRKKIMIKLNVKNVAGITKYAIKEKLIYI